MHNSKKIRANWGATLDFRQSLPASMDNQIENGWERWRGGNKERGIFSPIYPTEVGAWSSSSLIVYPQTGYLSTPKNQIPKRLGIWKKRKDEIYEKSSKKEMAAGIVRDHDDPVYDKVSSNALSTILTEK